MCETETRTFQIVDRACSARKEVYVSSLNQLVQDVQAKFDLIDDVKIVLESDGTIVDDEEYFATLEPNTCLMVLKSDESWKAPASRCIVKDEVDFVRPNLSRLIHRVRNDTVQLVMLSHQDLELLTNADPETLDFPEKNFLRDIQEACNLYLNDRNDAKDFIQIMKMYHDEMTK